MLGKMDQANYTVQHGYMEINTSLLKVELITRETPSTYDDVLEVALEFFKDPDDASEATERILDEILGND